MRCTQPISVWRDFENGKHHFSWQDYQTLWQRYKFLRKVSEEQYLIKKFLIHLYISFAEIDRSAPLDDPAAEFSKAPPKDKKIDDTLAKRCPQELTKGRQVLSYEMIADRQPNLVRNFLVLSKLGYFDKKEIRVYHNLSFDVNQTAVLYFGLDDKEQDPFYVRPDPRFTSSNAPINIEKYLPPATGEEKDLRDVTGITLDRAEKLLKTNTSYGALAGLAENLTDFDGTRRVWGLKVGIPLLKSALEDDYARFNRAKTYPIPFAKAVRKKKPYLSLQNMLNDINGYNPDEKQHRYIIDCVEIPEPTEIPFAKPQPEFPVFKEQQPPGKSEVQQQP